MPGSIRSASSAARTAASFRAGTRTAGDAQLGYTVPNLLIEYVMRNTHVPVGPWRGVNTNQNGRLHGVLHRGMRARRRQGLARIPPCADEQASQASRGAQCRGREGRLGQAVARGRASRHRAVHGLWQLFGGDRRSLGEHAGQAEGAPHGAGARTAATPSTRTRSPRRSRARSPTGFRPPSTARW